MNVTEVVFSGFYKTQICGLYQYDYGQVLKFTDITLPSTYEVHFAQSGASTTVTVLGGENGVQIPDQYLLADLDIRAYIYLHEEETDGETVYQVLIPVIARPEPTDVEPTPVEQDIITQTIAALNSAVDTAEDYAADASQSASDSAASAISAQAWAEAAQESAESIDMSTYATKAALQSEESARSLADTSLGNDINAETQRATQAEASIRLAIPSKTSQLQNDSGFLTSAPVSSVNGKTGAVSLSASDVGALPASTAIPSKTSDLVNDSHYITAAEAPVQSVNGQTGAVTISTATTSADGLMSSQDKVNLDAVRGQIGDLKSAVTPLFGTDKFFDNNVLYNSTFQKVTQTVNVSNTGFVRLLPAAGLVFFDAVKGDKFIVLAKVRSAVSNDHQYVIRLRKYIGDTGTGTYYLSDTFTTNGISVVVVENSDATKVELSLARKYTGSATTNFSETFDIEYLMVIKGDTIAIWNDKAQATAESALTEIDNVRSTLLKTYPKTDIVWERGYYSADGTEAGSKTSSTIRSATTDYIQACAGSRIGLNNNLNSTVRMRYCIYTEPTEEAFVSRLQVSSVNMVTISTDCYLRIFMEYLDGRAFDFDEYVATLPPCLEMEIIQYKNNIVIDGALSDTSENPVQNKVITQSIDAIRVPQTFPTSWQSKIETVNTAKGDKFTFAIQTDTHYYIGYGDQSAYNLKLLTNYVGFDFVANLGDVIRGYANETIDSPENMRTAFTDIMHRYVTGISCPLMVAMGNHDTNAMWANAYGGSPFSFAEVWGRMFRPSFNTNVNAVTQTGLMYYYTDFDDVRVIVLNTQDGGNGGFGIGSDQLAWFTNTALSTDKWVLVMSHVPLVDGWSVSSNYVSSYANVVTALQNFKTNSGKVIGCMSGHTHIQENQTVDGILFVTFKNGADTAEVAMVDLKNKTIDTIPVGVTGAGNRSFTFN